MFAETAKLAPEKPELRNLNEKSRPGFRHCGVRSEPGPGLAGRAFLARPTVCPGTAAVVAVPGRHRFPRETSGGFFGPPPIAIWGHGRRNVLPTARWKRHQNF